MSCIHRMPFDGKPLDPCPWCRITELEAQISASKDVCGVCGGEGEPVSGVPCICGGVGTLYAEAQGLREALYDTKKRARRGAG